MSRVETARERRWQPMDAGLGRLPNVLITGGSGFLGREVGRRLAAVGLNVRGTVRSEGQLPDGVEAALVPDLLDESALASALIGIDAVVHLAGLAHVMDPVLARDERTFHRINTEGTRTVLDAARAAGARRVIHISSAAAASGGVSHLAADIHGTPEGAYGRSKLEAERLVRMCAERDGLSAVILRPAMTYGPGMKGNPLRLFRWVQRGLPVPVSRAPNRRSLLFSGNLAAAIEALLRSPDVTGTFYVADRETLSTEELVRTIASALGKRTRVLRVPRGMLWLAARAGDKLRPIVPWPIDSTVVRRLTGSCVIDASALSGEARFSPSYSTEQGIIETAAWYLARERASASRTGSRG